MIAIPRALAALMVAAATQLYCALAVSVTVSDRQHILIVGSSTAYPIVSAAAEFIGRQDDLTTPVVESTGTGGGIKFFCSGYGLDTPDIVMASRRMRSSEQDDCLRNQVNDIREIKIGYDGIVIASSKDTPSLALSKRELHLAIAREVPSPRDPTQLVANPYQTWKQINSDLPDIAIRVLGPPPTSGTRDILVERVLKSSCRAVEVLNTLLEADPTAFAHRCATLREDGVFVNSGENDARVVRKLLSDPGALGIFGFNFLDRNPDRLKAASIDSIEPDFESIKSGVYPLSRPLYLYVKPLHMRLVGGLDHFVETIISPAMSGNEGYLVEHGLIPLNAADRAAANID